MVDPTGTQQFFELWRKQFEEGAQTWARMVSSTPPPSSPVMDPMAFWRPVLNSGLETWARLFAMTPASPDLMQQWKQFLDQWIEAWSKALGQVMATEGFAQMMGRSLDQMLTMMAPMKKATQQSVDSALETLNLASRSQLTSVAQQIVDLEDRVERVEDGIAAILRKLDELARPAGTRAGSAAEAR
jgi:hypothetical protein